jgi:N-acetyl-gamma-glutamyl-phosphate reductase
MTARLKAAVLGTTGYSGQELTRLLARHPRVEPFFLRRESGAGAPETGSAQMLPSVSGNGDHALKAFSWEMLRQQGVELLFLATPHEVSRDMVPEAMDRGLRVIDLSGAWRLKQQEHRAVYQFADRDSGKAGATMDRAVYGLPELHHAQIAGAKLVANPGCYATSIILGLAPLLRAGWIDRKRGIISDSKSGVSGAGKEPTSRTHFVSVADNLSAYSVFGHRHTGEILEQLQLEAPELIFTPHLLPIPRGIFSTIYVHLARPTAPEAVEACYRDFYAGMRWVRTYATPQLPQIQFSLQSNYCDIGFCLADDRQRLIVVSCLDNLLKGAAGQAVQNMNVMYGWNEEEGLN